MSTSLSPALPSSTKRRVSYFYQSDVGLFYYGPGHPMKPHRIRMAHQLILAYGLYRKMEVYRPKPATDMMMASFHSDEYISFLKKINPDNIKQFSSQVQKHNMGEFTDCPIFDGIHEFSTISSGCSIDGAVKLNHGLTDIAINWSGGLHHAKKSEASGFCYVNDIVLAILELLKYNPRVLYIDIDVHHGDGVEEAFYTTDRVMTVSFHKYGDFFPGTGDIKDVGTKAGKYYSVNVPLQEGIDDASYESIFKPVVDKVMEMYRPTAVVLQCGADSLTGDRLGCFNLTLHGHAKCVEHVKSFNLPMLVVGGGGYTVRNVARCWTYETSVLIGTAIPNELPYNDFYEYYAPDFKLHLTPTNAENTNKRDMLDSITQRILSNLQNLQGAPSVQFSTIPPDTMIRQECNLQESEDRYPDKRPSQSMNKDGSYKKEVEEEYYDHDKDQDNGSNGNGKKSRKGKQYLTQAATATNSVEDNNKEEGEGAIGQREPSDLMVTNHNNNIAEEDADGPGPDMDVD